MNLIINKLLPVIKLIYQMSAESIDFTAFGGRFRSPHVVLMRIIFKDSPIQDMNPLKLLILLSQTVSLESHQKGEKTN